MGVMAMFGGAFRVFLYPRTTWMLAAERWEAAMKMESREVVFTSGFKKP